MQLKELILRHFRNYTHAAISFSKGINVLYGQNGVGKTNILEAIYLLTTGRSFRTPYLTDLIQNGKKAFFLEARFTREGVNQTLRFFFDGKQRKIQHNDAKQTNSAALLGLFPSVLYAPKDGNLITGSPAERRRFLNIQLAQTNALYAYHLIRYHKALKQRNALLKREEEQTIESWEKVLAESGSYLITQRKLLTNHLKPMITHYANILSEKEFSFSINYQNFLQKKQLGSCVLSLKEQLAAFLKESRPKDRICKATLIGPHRDDLLITYAKKEAKTYASEGQKRICISALKLAEWECLSSKISSYPLLSIDDVGVHLDATRSHLLEEKLKECGQVFLTTPHLLSIEANYIEIRRET